MLYEKKELPEIHYMKHRHDSNKDWVDYENNILNKSLSPYLYENDVMNGYLNRIQSLASIQFDQINFIKNFKNYMVDKYYYKQK
jgi:hypothetical protein